MRFPLVLQEVLPLSILSSAVARVHAASAALLVVGLHRLPRHGLAARCALLRLAVSISVGLQVVSSVLLGTVRTLDNLVGAPGLSVELLFARDKLVGCL